MTRINKEAVFVELPAQWPRDLLPKIRQSVAKSDKKIVVLDDDPTGTQTVHGVSVLTDWSIESLAQALMADEGLFFILTNSRSLPAKQAEALNREIARNLIRASRSTGTVFEIISRSDSTLRGHFPQEVDWLIDELNLDCDGVIMAPFFPEGGRFTIGNIHYVAEDDWLVPVGETEYAQDPTFGYLHSNLRDWIEEKTGGRVTRDSVAVVDLETLRTEGPGAVAGILRGLHDQQPCIVNAAAYRDLEVFVAGLLMAQSAGKSFIYRTAASFVRVRGGISPRPLLTASEMLDEPIHQQGGLMVVGSYVEKTTQQLGALLDAGLAFGIEVSVEKLIDPNVHSAEVARARKLTEQKLIAGLDVVLYTSRKKITTRGSDEFLDIGRGISEGLVGIVRELSIRPAWLVVKGGITSSVIATDGLGVKKAGVMGQILPGVPVWKLGEESRFPGSTYVVFPGNVGGEDALVEVIQRLSRE